MIPDGAGGAFVVWRDTRHAFRNGDDIYLQRISSGMVVAPGWPADGVAVVAAPFSQDFYRLIADGTGGVIVVWSDTRGSLATSVDIYAQRVAADGTIPPGWPAQGLPLCTAPGPQVRPVLASDGVGGAIVAWEDYRAGGGTGSEFGDVYATRVTPNGTLAPGWLPDGNPVSTAPNLQMDPVVVQDGVGGAIIAWGEAGPGDVGAGVRALRLTGAGVVASGWQVAGATLSAAPRPQSYGKQIVSDGVGGAIVAWLDTRNSDEHEVFPEADLFAQRLLADGTLHPGWPTNGTALCQAPGTQSDMDMVGDGAGGAVIVWEDYRSNEADVYGQRITESGSIASGWLEDGTPLAIGPGYQLTPRAAFHGSSGVMLAFVELIAGGTYDIAAQRVLLDGSFPPGWTLNPRPLCVGIDDDDYQPAVASDGTGGLIVVSQHASDPDYDLHANWVPSTGPTPTLLALVTSEATIERVTLTWFGAEAAGLTARLERRDETTEWASVATLNADGGGILRYEDCDIAPGGRYGYRLSYYSGGQELTTADVWVTVPLLAFALHGAQPNPVTGPLVVAFSLASTAPARLDVFDLAGRQVLVRDVAMGPGTHRIDLTHGERLPAGIYTLRLTQGERRATTRVVALR